MTNYMTIERTRIGWRIKDTITNKSMHYVYCTKEQAEKRHRNWLNLKNKHFTKIYIQEEK